MLVYVDICQTSQTIEQARMSQTLKFWETSLSLLPTSQIVISPIFIPAKFDRT